MYVVCVYTSCFETQRIQVNKDPNFPKGKILLSLICITLASNYGIDNSTVIYLIK